MNKLCGQRILVTRSAEDASEWASRLEQAGAVPIVYPCIRAETLDTPKLRSELETAVGSADWIVFTSRRGVEAFAALCASSAAARPQIAVVGPATADAARARLGRVDLIGAGGTAAALGAALADASGFGAGARCVLALAENAGSALERSLAAAGARCRRFDVYRTIPHEPREPKERLSRIRADKIIFASPTAVTGFLNQVAIDTALSAVTIGPSTSAAARAHGLAVAAEAREASLEGILESLDA